MTHFEFGVEFQRSFLRLLMLDEAFCHKAMTYINPGFFTVRSLGWVFASMQRYYKEYGVRCTEIPLREAGRREPVYASEVEAIIAIGFVSESDYIKAQLREFVRRNLFARAHEESQTFYNDGQHAKAYDVMCEAMDKLRSIEFDAPDRSWFFDEIEGRMRRRLRTEPTDGVYPMGIEQIDDLMNGGPKRGETHVVIGEPKIGKTIWLINQAFVATRVCRVPVLYVNLEGGTKLIEDRLDSCYSTEFYHNVRRGEITPKLYREMIDEYKALRRLMVIRTLNDWDVNILHIDAELKELESEGFKPEVIYIDYVDLMRSRHRVQTETAHQTDAMKDIKRLSNRGYLVWSVCQSQRSKEKDEEKERILRASDIADAYSKIRIADGYGSLNATKEEQIRNECRLYWEGYRDAKVGRMFRLFNDSDKMRLATKVVEEKPKTSSTGTGKSPKSASATK